MQMTTSPLAGIPGTDATSSKRGYYYQDVATALAWTKLGFGEELQIELAEDYAVATDDQAEVTQVKNMASTLTLVSGLEFLERALQITEENSTRELSFVYLTTSSVGKEKNLAHRPNGRPGISYWQDVQSGADPCPLVAVLGELAHPQSRLAALIAKETVEGVVDALVRRVTWAVKSPETSAVKSDLKERVARIAHEECRVELVEGRRLWTSVLDAVTDISTQDNSSRVLTYNALRDLVRNATTVTLTKRKYAELVNSAELAKNPPVAQINSDIERRFELLRKTRFFSEANLEERARSLAEDVKDGGACQLGEPSLRARALAGCARALLEHSELADELLSNAERIAVIPETRLVRALLVARADTAQGLRLIADNRSPAAETIRYAIARLTEGGGGLTWVEKNQAQPKELDHGGQFLVLWDLLQKGCWAAAITWVEKIHPSAFGEFPALLWAGAHALTAWAATDGAQYAALSGPPIVNEIPLKDDVPALVARRRAVELFNRFHPVAKAWELNGTADLALEFSLWLMLEDKQSHPAAVVDVSRLWKESSNDSRWVPLALRAGVELDIDSLATRIDRHASRYGSLSMDDARARLALVVASPAEKWVGTWPSIQQHICMYFNEAFLQHIYIQGLIQIGRIDDARVALRNAIDLPDLERQRFEIELGSHDELTLAQYRTAVEEDGSAASMHNLISALARAGNLTDAISFAERSYEQTREHGDAEAYMRLLARQGRWNKILEFLDAHKFLIEQSTLLARMYIDVQVRFGRWNQARELAQSIPDLEENRHELELGLAISSGHWEKIGLLLERAQANTDATSVDLLRYGQIATNLGSFSLAKRFVKRAVEIGNNEVATLWSGYMLAVQGHWEDDPLVRDWFAAGIASADSEGSPLQSRSLADLVEMAPRWRERTDALAESVAAADMFLALAAQQLNRPLASLTVGTAVSNESESDFRRLTPIGAFAGTAKSSADIAYRSIVLDATAMLTMARLKLLPKLLDCFEVIHVPHGVGAWLFSEYSRVRFHQPGRIAEARRLLQTHSRKEVRVADSGHAFSRPLSAEVGVDLAQLISACEADQKSGKDAFVVRSTPLHRVGSLLGDSAEIGQSAALFRSTLEVMKSLRRYGAVATSTYEDAMSYLSRVDNGWPNEETIPKGATLYLDDLAVTYFQHVGVMRALADAKFDVVIHPDVHANAVALSALEDVNEAVGEALDEIRQFFVEGQSRNVVVVLPQPAVARMKEGDAEEVAATVLLSQLFERAEGADAIIIDDRAANRHLIFTYPDGSELPLRTSIDILDWMLSGQHMDEREWLRSRTLLRRSGYLFVPVTAKELSASLDESTVHDGELFESVSARAIRESHLLAQAAAMLRMPDEAPWLMNFGQEVVAAVTNVWSSEESNAVAAVKATWLLELSRFDGFADRMLGENEETRWVTLDAMTILRFLMNLMVPDDRRAAYNEWLQNEFLGDMVQSRPIVFASLCGMVRHHLLGIPAAIAADEEVTNETEKLASAVVTKEFINHLPQSIRDVLFEDDDLFEQLGLARSTVITAHVASSPEFDSEQLYRTAALVHGDRAERVASDNLGREWRLSVGSSGVVACSNEERTETFHIAHSPLVSPVLSERIQYAKAFAKSSGVSESQAESWLLLLSSGPIRSSRIAEFERDFQDCPHWKASRIRKLLNDGKIGVRDLVPTTRKYYERLVPSWAGNETVGEFASWLVEASEQQTSPLQRLLWSAHQVTAQASLIGEVDAATLKGMVAAEGEFLDLWSLVGLAEGLVARQDAFGDLLDLTTQTLEKLSHLLEVTERLDLTSSLVSLVDAAVNTSGIFSEVPVYWRRLATIAHAALIEREVLRSSIERKGFLEWANSSWPLFQVATLADLPREPRWNGFMIHAAQLKQELLGRLLTAVEGRREEIVSSRLNDLVFGEGSESLQSRRIALFSALPGPLEGSTIGAPPLPDELIAILESSLEDARQPLFHRVQAAAHVAGLGCIPNAVASKLTQSVTELDKGDFAIDARDHVEGFAMRLSLAAAASRDTELATAVKQLILGQPKIPLALRAYAGISACAVEEHIEDWTRSVAHVLARCTHLCDKREEAQYVLFVLRTLCDVRPSLRPSVAQTYARLQGIAKRLN